MRLLVVSLLSSLLMSACATYDNDCEAGRQMECECPGGAVGVHVCGDDSTWSECQCCEPDCRGLLCGDDGCGGTCGTCHDCDGQVDDDLCDEGQCQIVCCPATCEDLDVECGTWPDGCGAEIDCGTCEMGVCYGGACYWDFVCSTREDCAGPTCLVCMDGECTEPPEVCEGHEDCCVGYYCNFGTCNLDECGCASDSDCLYPDFPRCNTVTCECEPECFTDDQCYWPYYLCIENHCVQQGCTPEQCEQGQWCNNDTGDCELGCDSNDDCMPPETCNYDTH